MLQVRRRVQHLQRNFKLLYPVQQRELRPVPSDRQVQRQVPGRPIHRLENKPVHIVRAQVQQVQEQGPVHRLQRWLPFLQFNVPKDLSFEYDCQPRPYILHQLQEAVPPMQWNFGQVHQL